MIDFLTDFLSGMAIVAGCSLILYFALTLLIALQEIPERLKDIEADIKEAIEMLNRRNNE